MATYLDLVNKVLDESGKEQNQLTLSDWDSAEAGRRLYPRVKRLVKEAWKMLQMKRNEWEFNSGELVTVLYPRLRFADGSKADGEPSVSSVWVGRKSGATITVRSVDFTGYWEDDEAYGQIEFTTTSNGPLVLGEIFDEQSGVGTFEYTGSGSYNLFYGVSRVRKPRWNTLRAKIPGEAYSSLTFVPWTQYLLGGFTETSGTSVPYYFSQDYMGNLVFYSIFLRPITVTFIYDMGPQEFSDPTDIPEGLPEEYHEWIAWEALMNLARFDKDPDLFAYAESQATVYRQRAERNLMPLVEWATSNYDR